MKRLNVCIFTAKLGEEHLEMILAPNLLNNQIGCSFILNKGTQHC